MSRAAVFIDGGYLQAITKQLQLKIDIGMLSEKMHGRHDLMRTFYYDCLPIPENNDPNPFDQKRIEAKERYFHSLEHLPRFTVRQGQMVFRGYNESGQPQFEQKRVDLLLGIDLVQAATKRVITDAMLLAGDSDFIPAVEVAKMEGVVVHLFHGHGTTHRDLIACCDERVELTPGFFKGLEYNDFGNGIRGIG